MAKVKSIFKPLYIKIIKLLEIDIDTLLLIREYYRDFKVYKKYSLFFNKNNIKNKEANIILQYHGLEKGFLYDKMKKGFAKSRITNLHILLNDKEVIANINRSQIKVGYQVMCQYYELHQKVGYDIEYIYSKEQYYLYKSILDSNYNFKFNGVLKWTKESFYQNNEENFKLFAHSRKSTRDFTGNLISHKLLKNAIELANTSPSVCNRQASNVYLLENKDKIDEVFKLQGGFTGYTNNVNQLLVLTNDIRYYFTIWEKNQAYIDGGIYLMNLLYSLHFYKIGNCPIHWAKAHSENDELRKVIKLPDSEIIICMIPIGELIESFKTTLSQRRSINENFHIL